jgi:dTMP kinase
MFISLEGIDGSGKTTQAQLLAESIGDALVLREPGGTALGERLRELLKDPELELDPMAELMLFCAARAELTEQVIRPALQRGQLVICDRFSDSSVAYQGFARGIGTRVVEQLCEAATGGLWPDITILLRVDPEVAAQRMAGEGRPTDRFEGEGETLQRLVARGYEEVLARHRGRVQPVDATPDSRDVHAAVRRLVLDRMDAQRRGGRR